MIATFTRLGLLIGMLLAMIRPAAAQIMWPTLEEFGRNRIQQQHLRWQVLTTSNFEVYFYGNNQSMATYTAQLAEAEFDRITDLLSYTPYNRTKIFLYHSPEALRQSNIGITMDSEADSREENLSKSRIEIAFAGNHQVFRKEIVRQIASVFVYDMLYGGSLKDALQSQLLLALPEWFIAGITAYIAEGWSSELDAYMRDMARSNQWKKPSQVSGRQATLLGQSIWNYIARQYGRDHIANILNLTRIIRTEQTSIASTLGLSYNRFLEEWQGYYGRRAEAVSKQYQLPAGLQPLALGEAGRDFSVHQVRLSPDQQWVAYAVTEAGRYKVYLWNPASGKTEKLLDGGYRFVRRPLELHPPLLAWQSDGSLAVILQENNRPEFLKYNRREGSSRFQLADRQGIRGFSQVSGFDIADNGATLVLSADRRGQNDLFLYRPANGSTQQLTNDWFDDLYPAFVGSSASQVVFASSRSDDTLRNTPRLVLTSQPLRLFLHDGNPRAAQLTMLSDSALQTLSPLASRPDRVYFLNDQNGIRNLFVADTATRTFRQVTGFPTGLQAYDLNPNTGALALLFIRNGKYELGFVPKIDLNQPVAPLQTGGPAGAATADNLTVPPVASRPPIQLRPGEVDTDNYQFDVAPSPVVRRQTEQVRTITNAPASPARTVIRRETNRVKGPTPYRDAFVLNSTNNQFLVVPYVNNAIGWQNTLTVNDLLENNIIRGGFLITPSFRTNEIFAEYQYLPDRIDYKVRFDRRAFSEGGYTLGPSNKYRYNRLTLTASYPVNEALRVGLSPMYTNTRLIDVAQATPTGSQTSHYAGGMLEMVFDNSTINGRNQREGTRAKLQGQYQQGMSNASESYYKVTLDARNYLRIYRELIFASRVSSGYSWGRAPKQGIIGGMDNWIPFSGVRELRTDTPLDNQDLRNVFLSDFVTPLRGFRLNKLSGTSYLLFNAELRWPLASFLHRGPLTSNFLRNLQLVGFTDVGTAWSGTGPFSRQNSLNTEIVAPPGNVFRATVTNFKNPFLIGYGVGLRTLFLGYYVKGDLAWGLEDKTVQDPIFHITLGYDF